MPKSASVSKPRARDAATAAPPPPPDPRAAIMAGLAGTIAAPRLPLSYRLLALPVAGVMLLLPAIYVALIAAVGWAVWWHATHDLFLFGLIGESHTSGRGAVTVAIAIVAAYVGPIFIGAVLVAFMLKPLFSRRRGSENTLVLDRREQPTLFEFADRLARHVGAPCPRQIEVDCDVNASARFRRGAASAIGGGGDLVLRIGLPLVSNLSLTGLAGILAHEFGHFAQRGGMTLTYVIRSTSLWFARVVYERDAWDAWLDGVAAGGTHWAITLVANLARAFVWLSRRALWCLMWVGQFVASIMLRQMEYDADRYETMLVGSEQFERTARSLKSIGLATHWAYEAVRAGWHERRLPDDLPALIARQHADVTPEAMKKLAEAADKSKTGWFDTHPSDRDRVAAARQLNAPGTLALDAPAVALFADFADLSRRATLARYFELLGPQVKPENLEPVEKSIAAVEEKEDHFRALSRYTQGVIRPVALAAPRPPEPARDLDATTMRVLELRNALVESAPAAREAIARLETARDASRRVAIVKSLRGAGISKVPAAALGFKRADAAELDVATRDADAARAAAAPIVRAAQSAAVERLSLALSLEPLTTRPPAPVPAPAPKDDEGDVYALDEGYELLPEAAPSETASLARAIAALDRARPTLEEIADEHGRLHVLLASLRPQGNDQALIGAVLSRGRSLNALLAQLRDALPAMPYPYDHAVRGATVRNFVMGTEPIPPRERPGDLFELSAAVQGRYFDLYGRVLSDLVHRAEAVEAHLGLAPLAAWEA